MKKIFLVISMGVLIISCSNLVEYNFQPLPNVNLKVVLNSLDNNSTVLYFDYKINNESISDIYFNFDSIKVMVDSIVSSEIYFNSIASVIATRKKLENGEHTFPLYAVFNYSIDANKLKSFKVISFGFVN